MIAKETIMGGLRSFASALWRGAGGPVLIVSIGTFAVRGVIISRTCRSQWKVERYAEVALETSARRTRARFMRLLEKMRPVEARRVIIASDEVSLIQVDLPGMVERRRWRRQQTLAAQAGLEIAPFLDYPREEAMLAVLECPSQARTDADDDGPEEVPRHPVLVCAMRRSVYESLENLCRSQKKRLIGVLPQECFAFAAGEAFQAAGEGIILDCRLHEIMAAHVYQGLPVAIERENRAPGEKADDAADRLVRRFSRPGGMPEEVVTGGDAPCTEGLETLLLDAGVRTARAWNLGEDLPFMESPGPLPAGFMQTMGAAACLCGHRRTPLLITSRVGLAARALGSIHTIPLLIVCLALISLGVDYAFLKQRTARLDHATTDYSQDLNDLKANIANEKTLEKSHEHLRSEKTAFEERIRLLTVTIPERDARLLKFLEGLIRLAPERVQLLRLQQFSDAIFFIEGQSSDSAGITRFVVDLKELDGVKECRLEHSQRQGSKPTPGAASGEVNVFSVRVRLEDKHA